MHTYINIYVALKPEDVIGFLEPVFKQARDLTAAYEGQEKSRTPFVSVCLSTSSTTSQLVSAVICTYVHTLYASQK